MRVNSWFCLALLAFSASVVAEERIVYLENPPWLISTVPRPTGILPDLSALLFVEVPAPKAVVVPARRLRADMANEIFQWAYWPCQWENQNYDSLGVVLQDAFGLVVRADAAIQKLSDLHGKNVGVWDSRLGMLPELERDATINKHEFNSAESALMMLKSSRLDAVVVGKTAFRWHDREASSVNGNFKYLQMVEVSHCLFAHRSVSEGDREKLTRRIQDVASQGAAAAVVERWLRQTSTPANP